VQILLNNHNGALRDATDLILQPAWPRVTTSSSDLRWLKWAYPADFNGDGFVDLLVEAGPGAPPSLFVNTGPAGGGRLVEVTEALPPFPDFAVSSPWPI